MTEEGKELIESAPAVKVEPFARLR